MKIQSLKYARVKTLTIFIGSYKKTLHGAVEGFGTVTTSIMLSLSVWND